MMIAMIATRIRIQLIGSNILKIFVAGESMAGAFVPK